MPQLRIHQQEALQLLLQLWAEQRGLVGGAPEGRESPAPHVAPPCPHRLSLLAALPQVAVVRPEFIPLAVGHLLELPQQSALL